MWIMYEDLSCAVLLCICVIFQIPIKNYQCYIKKINLKFFILKSYLNIYDKYIKLIIEHFRI